MIQTSSKAQQPKWVLSVLGIDTFPSENETIRIGDQEFRMLDGILRSSLAISAAQKQTQDSFGFKWKKRDTYERDAVLFPIREWLTQRYGDMRQAEWLFEGDHPPLVLDAGCGAAMSAIELFEPVWARIRYLGVDISDAVDVMGERLTEKGLSGAFLQADLMNLPLPPGSVDVVFSEGVLHHTDSTEKAIKKLAPLLKAGGRFMFYVYRKKGPIREFSDDYVRGRLNTLSPQDAWDALMPLTKLGEALGRIEAELDIPEAIDLLEIPAGRISIQRLFYWHVFKAFYHPELTLEEMNHRNFDWFTPTNAHRQTLEEVTQWCAGASLEVERERVEEAGITIIAKKL